MIEDLLVEPDAPAGTRPAPAARRRGRERLGPLSLWLLLAALVLQVVALVLQFSYLLAPRPGEIVGVVIVTGLASLVGFIGVVCGFAGAMTRAGRRTGALGAALGLAFLVLFAAATSFGFGFLEALSTPV